MNSSGETLAQKILLVEDEEDANRYYRLSLQAEGFDVVGVFNGADAIAEIGKSDFDIVLLDIMMSGMDGIETCSKIRESFDGKTLPICMITASMDVEKVVSAFEAGADGYIVKPFDIDELLAKLSELTDLSASI